MNIRRVRRLATRLSLVVFALISFSLEVCAQSGVQIRNVRTNGKSIPNPEKRLELAALLANNSVIGDIGLSDESKVSIRGLLEENHGSLSVPVLTFDGDGPQPSAAELASQVAEFCRSNEAKLNDIIDPIEMERLKQIAYQLEITRIGLGKSLTNGFLGEHIGVEESQRSALQTKSDNVEGIAFEKIAQLKAAARSELFAELTSMQQGQLSLLLGATFLFRDDPSTLRFELRLKRADGSKHAVTEPSSLSSIAANALNDSVASALKLTSSQRAALRKIHEDAKSPLPHAGLRFRDKKVQIDDEIKNQLEEILLPEQRARLFQIVFRIEIERIGVVDSLLLGYLGKEIGIVREQHRSLTVKAETLEPRLREGILKIQAELMDQVFQELKPIQRTAAIKIVGKPFLYRDE
jgi:hypothetical protein